LGSDAQSAGKFAFAARINVVLTAQKDFASGPIASSHLGAATFAFMNPFERSLEVQPHCSSSP